MITKAEIYVDGETLYEFIVGEDEVLSITWYPAQNIMEVYGEDDDGGKYKEVYHNLNLAVVKISYDDITTPISSNIKSQ